VESTTRLGGGVHDTIVEEGCEGSGCGVRESLSIPADSAARKKHFLTVSNLSDFTFEAGRLYQADFGNGYLDFNDFSLKLPGFSLNVVAYIDSKTHELRYTLKNRRTEEVYSVVVFTLLFGRSWNRLSGARCSECRRYRGERERYTEQGE